MKYWIKEKHRVIVTVHACGQLSDKDATAMKRKVRNGKDEMRSFDNIKDYHAGLELLSKYESQP